MVLLDLLFVYMILFSGHPYLYMDSKCDGAFAFSNNVNILLII